MIGPETMPCVVEPRVLDTLLAHLDLLGDSEDEFVRLDAIRFDQERGDAVLDIAVRGQYVDEGHEWSRWEVSTLGMRSYGVQRAWGCLSIHTQRVALLAEGPQCFIQAYADVLRDEGAAPSVLDGARALGWDGQSYVAVQEKPNLSVLTLGEAFFIAVGFEETRRT